MLRILIAVDGSEPSLDAVRHAIGLRAQGLKARLVLANVQEPPSLYEMLTVHDAERLASLGAGAGEHLLQAARELCDYSGVDYEFEVATGDPAHTLVDIAERYGCGSIIIGARGKGSTVGGWLGSVSHELVHVSPVPVTVIKHVVADERPHFDEHQELEDPVPADSELQPLLGLA